MCIVGRTVADVRNLLVHVALYTPTSWRIKLGQITDFHGLVMLSKAEASLIDGCPGNEKLEIPRLCSE